MTRRSGWFPAKKEAWNEGNYKIIARYLYGKTRAISCSIIIDKNFVARRLELTCQCFVLFFGFFERTECFFMSSTKFKKLRWRKNISNVNKKTLWITVKFLQEEIPKRRAKISAYISARLFEVKCNKVWGIPIHKDWTLDVRSWTQHILLSYLCPPGGFLPHLMSFYPTLRILS